MAILPGALGRMPAAEQPVGRRDGKQAHIAPVFGDKAARLDSLGCDGPRIGDHHLCIRAGASDPVRAGRDIPCFGSRELPLRLRQRPR